jgi:Lon protease-like protein
MRPPRIPLFPLDVVLFPRMALPLHIFEPRYKLMVRHCLDEKLEFGMVLSRFERIARVGCTTAILSIVRTHPDGTMDILTEGRSAFQVMKVFEDKPYHEAAVEYLDEIESASAPDSQPSLLGLYEKCHNLVFGRAPEVIELRPGASLAYFVAGSLPLELDYRQELLELREEAMRQENLIDHLNDWLPRVEHLHHMRKKAGGNGHGLS